MVIRTMQSSNRLLLDVILRAKRIFFPVPDLFKFHSTVAPKGKIFFLGSSCTSTLVINGTLGERRCHDTAAQGSPAMPSATVTGVGNRTVGTILSSLADHFLPPSRSPEKSSLLFALEQTRVPCNADWKFGFFDDFQEFHGRSPAGFLSSTRNRWD